MLAREPDADLLLINKRDGRRAAKNSGIKVKGTIGVISDCIERRILTVGSAGSILSMGSRMQFQIIRTRSRVQALFGTGALILAVLCGAGVSYFYSGSAKIFS